MMNHVRSVLASLFRADDEVAVAGTRNVVSFHRLLLLIGGILASGVGVLQMTLNPEGATPAWPSVLLGGLFAGLLAASYLSAWLRQHVVAATRVLLYGLMGWLALVTIQAGFGEGEATILLFAYALLTPAIGYGGRSFGPAIRFAGASLLVTAGGALFTSAPEGQPMFLLGCILATTFVEALGARLLTRRSASKSLAPTTARKQSLPSVTENAPAALFRTAPGEGLIYANKAFAETFGYGDVVDVMLADFDSLFADPTERDRLWNKAKREGGLRSIEMELKRKNRTLFTGLLNIRVVYSKDDEVICCDGTVTDISSRKRREEVHRESLVRLARTADEKDYGGDGHVGRVGMLARLIAGSLGLPDHWQNRIQETALFHDVGKIGIAESILRKPGRLSDGERQTMKQHASIGPALLSGTNSGHLRTARRIARSHHERWDGGGYPDGLEGNDIPLAARIVAVADAFDAMTHDRPYREALSPDEAFAVIRDEAGGQFDPKISKAALRCRNEMTEIVTDEDASVEPAAPVPEMEDVQAVTPSLAVPQPA